MTSIFLRVSDFPQNNGNHQEEALVQKLRLEGVEVEPDGVMLLRKWGSQRCQPGFYSESLQDASDKRILLKMSK